jgi:hypothetical protein
MDNSDFNLDYLERADEAYFDRLKVFKEARFRLGLRGGLMLVGLVIGAYFIFVSRNDVGYYFKKDAPVIELGDVRAKDFDASRVQSLVTNDRVSYENDVVVFDDLESEKFSFYYSPLTNFVVRTEQSLPDKEVFRIADRIVELNSFEAGLISQRKAFPSDLAVRFSGEGRVVSGAEMPKWAMPVLQYMSNSSGVPVTEMRLFLDGDQPEDYAPFLYLIIGAFVLMLGTFAFFTDAWMRYLRAKRQLNRIPGS